MFRHVFRALLAVAYDAMLWRSQLEDLQVTDMLEEKGGGTALLVRRSKTDVEGKGGITEGRLFRSVGKGGRLGEVLDPSQVPRVFKDMARQAGLPPTAAAGVRAGGQ